MIDINSILQQNNSLPGIEEVKGTYRNAQAQQAYNQPIDASSLMTPLNIEDRVNIFKNISRTINESFKTDEDFTKTYMNYQQSDNMPINWNEVDEMKKSQASSNIVKAKAAYKDAADLVEKFGQFDPSIFPNKSQGATRSLPIQDDLYQIIGTAANAHGFTIRLGSGGQDDTTGRVGSDRHDHGHAGDIDVFYKGKRLRPDNPEDVELLKPFVRDLYRLGATSVGAGPGYMGGSRLHVDNAIKHGQGNSAPYWGQSGKKANAPKWLREAHKNSM